MGIVQTEIANAISVDIPMYSRYERGLRQIKEEHIGIIASKLKIDYAELRKMWIADKILNVVSAENDVPQILSIVIDNMTKSRNLPNND